MNHRSICLIALVLLLQITLTSGFYRFRLDRTTEEEERQRPLQARDGDEFCKLQNLQYIVNYGWKEFPMSEWPIEHAGAQFMPDIFAPLQPDPEEHAREDKENEEEKPKSAALTCLDIRVRAKSKQGPKASELESNPMLSMAYMARDERREYTGVQMYCLEGMTMSIAKEKPHVYNKIRSQVEVGIHMSNIGKSGIKKTALRDEEYVHPTKVRCHGTPKPESLTALLATLNLSGLGDRKTGRGRKHIDYTAKMPGDPEIPAKPEEPQRTVHLAAGETKCVGLELALKEAWENLERKRAQVVDISTWNEAAPSKIDTRQVRPRLDPDADTEGQGAEEFSQPEEDFTTNPRIMRLQQLGLQPQAHVVTLTPVPPLIQNPGHQLFNAPYIDLIRQDHGFSEPTQPSLRDSWERIYNAATLQAAQLNPTSTYTACTSAPLSNDLMLTFNSFFDGRK